jgi:predicted hotdog family 3-hydroxylacyl-ACP dehydratase
MIEALTELLPHRPPALFLEKIAEVREGAFVAEGRVHESSLGYDPALGGIPAWFGIEHMAQTIAAWNSMHSPSEEGAPIGFIASVRNYESTLDAFPLGAVVSIAVRPNGPVTTAGVFECELWVDEVSVARGTLGVVRPDLTKTPSNESA